MDQLQDLVRYARTQKKWDLVCDYAELNIAPLRQHLDMWGPHCGAPAQVYRGHLVRMLLDCAEGKE